MRLGVVACAACGRVQAVELRHARVHCSSCRKPVDLKDARFYYRGDDEPAARAMVQRVSAQRQGMGIEEYAQLLAAQEEERAGTVDDVLEVLALRSEFTAQEFLEEMTRHRVPGDRTRALAQLAADNRVYQPRSGVYRAI